MQGPGLPELHRAVFSAEGRSHRRRRPKGQGAPDSIRGPKPEQTTVSAHETTPILFSLRLLLLPLRNQRRCPAVRRPRLLRRE